MAVVVDSSAWIDFLAGKETPEVDDAVTGGTAVMPPLAVAELITGAENLEMRRDIGELLQDVTVHDTPLAHWIDVGELRRVLRRKGVNITIPDAHVAQCALDLDAPLLTRDAVFKRIAAHTPLRLRR